MCMFDKMFEEGGHKFWKRSPKQGATCTNSRVTTTYNPSRDNFGREFYQNVRDWRSIPPTGYVWKSVQQQAEEAQDQKPFSYLTIGNKSTHYDDSSSEDSSREEKKKKKIKKDKKDKHKKKHSKSKKEKGKKEKKDKHKRKHTSKKDKKKKHHRSKRSHSEQ